MTIRWVRRIIWVIAGVSLSWLMLDCSCLEMWMRITAYLALWCMVSFLYFWVDDEKKTGVK